MVKKMVMTMVHRSGCAETSAGLRLCRLRDRDSFRVGSGSDPGPGLGLDGEAVLLRGGLPVGICGRTFSFCFSLSLFLRFAFVPFRLVPCSSASPSASASSSLFLSFPAVLSPSFSLFSFGLIDWFLCYDRMTGEGMRRLINQSIK